MNKIYAIVIIIFFPIVAAHHTINLSVSNTSQKSRMNIGLLAPSSDSLELKSICATIKKDLEFTDQFQVKNIPITKEIEQKELRKQIQQLADNNIPLALHISINDGVIVWKLYDTFECALQQGKKIKAKKNMIRSIGHAIADKVYNFLTGHSGFFSSCIAYCKDIKLDNGKTKRNVYIAGYDGSHEKLVVDTNTICFAPRWDQKKPYLYYSENTDKNIRLMGCSFETKKAQHKEISNFDGVNMHYSMSPSGKQAVFSASRGNGNCQVYLLESDQLKRCTHNTGNNSSPIFIDEDHICFCSDFQTGSPQLYIGNIKTNHIQRITAGGYCTSPSYDPITNQIAYHKMMKGTMQIMLYDRAHKKHTQVTYDYGNKRNSSWAPDGTHLLYEHEKNRKSSLCMFSILTHTVKNITKGDESYSYPHWSPHYAKSPILT